ncbi:MAG: WD40 repeat domain-containing protein, partial [Verrucomicrobiales bacterium]|nr:WD40 repeat domain-containing protein [Verrucomicrobiales bacterium]
EAESERVRADAQARKAVESQEHSRRLLYAAEMNLAQQAVNQNNLGRARRLLDRHRPRSGEEDLRGWEWRYLWQQCRSDALAVLTEKPGKPGMSVSFSPDGTRLAVGYGGDSIEVWDVARRTVLRKLEGAGRDVHLAFSPRSDLLAVTQMGTTLALHDLSTGRDPILWKGTNGIRGISFTSDGRRLTALTHKLQGGKAITFDGVQGVALSTNATSGASRLEGAACQSADGKRLFLSDRNPTNRNWSVRCLDPATGRPLWEAELGMRDPVTAMALSPDDRFIAAGTGWEEAVIHVWDAATGRLVTRLKGHSSSVSELTFSRDGRRLASASADQTIRIWDTSGEPTGWTERRILRGHQDQVLCVAFSPDGRMLASGGKDGFTLLWDPEGDRKSPYGYRLLPAEVQDLREISPGVVLVNGTMNAGTSKMGSGAKRPYILRLSDLSEAPVPSGFDLGTLHEDLAPTLFARYEQTNILRVAELGIGWSELFNEPVGPDLQSYVWADLPAVRGDKQPLATEQRMLAWATKTGTVHVADLGPSKRRWQWTSGLASPDLQRFNPEGTLLAIAGTNHWIGNSPYWRKGLEIRSVTTGELLLRSDRILGEGSVRFAGGGRRLVAITPTNNEVQVLFWDLSRPEQPPRAFTEDAGLFGIYDVHVSPDGRWTSIRSRQGETVVYDAVAMERSSVVQAAGQQVFSSTFSPDSRRLATGASGRETLQLWQVGTGRELLTLPGTGSVFFLQFAEDGNTLLAGSPARGSWQMWRAPSWEVIQAAEAKDAASTAPGGAERAESRKP